MISNISTLKKINRLSKCIKYPKYLFKSNLFFFIRGVCLTLRFWVVLNQRLFLGKLT